MATADLAGGARADHGAQFLTVRSAELAADLGAGLADGTVHEWCRGFGTDDGHPRYAVTGGMAALPARLAAGTRRAPVRPRRRRGARRGRLAVSWPAAHGAPAGALPRRRRGGDLSRCPSRRPARRRGRRARRGL